MDVKVVGEMRENLSFQALSARPFFRTCMNIKTLVWYEVVAAEEVPRDSELLVNLKEKTLSTFYTHITYTSQKMQCIYIRIMGRA